MVGFDGSARAIFRSDAGELPGALMEAAELLDALDREAAERLAAPGGRRRLRAAALAECERRKTWRETHGL